MSYFTRKHNNAFTTFAKKLKKITLIKHSINECDQFSVRILSIRDIEEMVIRKACNHHEIYTSQIVEIGFFRKFQGTKKSRTEPYSRRSFVKNCIFYQNVRSLREHFHISHEN